MQHGGHRTLGAVYGPPPHPDQVLVPLGPGDAPEAWVLCLALGLGITALAALRRQAPALRAWWFCLGQTVALTAPLAVVLERVVYGAFPTIDKSGSLLFYLEGVHRSVTFHPLAAVQEPAARLIGVHVGHLWLTEAFDLFLGPHGAFNAQALFQVALGWWAAALLLRTLCGRWDTAVILALPFGLNLHVFRDLNWYTIEKSAVFGLALYAWSVTRCWQRGGRWTWGAGLVFAGLLFLNGYLALVGAAGIALALAATRDRRLLVHCAWATAFAAPLVALQLALLSGPGTLGDPERFLVERALLDSFTLWPPAWNRLELYRSLNGVVIGLAVWGAWRLRHEGRVRTWALVGAGLFALALGPELLPGVPNPVYLGVRAVVPGFWRVAKPETFFHGTWLALLALAALAVSGRRVRWLYPVFVIGWCVVVRTHPAFPGFTEPVDQELAPDWAERVSP